MIKTAMTPWWPCTNSHRSYRQRHKPQPESCVIFCNLSGTQEACKKLLWDHLPLFSLPLQGGYCETVSNHFLSSNMGVRTQEVNSGMGFSALPSQNIKLLLYIIYKYKIIKYKFNININLTMYSTVLCIQSSGSLDWTSQPWGALQLTLQPSGRPLGFPCHSC